MNNSNTNNIEKKINELLNKTYENLKECINDVFLYSSLYATDGVNNGIGGPFGAGIIQKMNNNNNNKYKVLVIERNTVLQTKDATCHAEINAIRKAEKLLDNIFLEDCILVSTAKSCPMCLSAACWAKIPVIYYGTDYKNATTSGFKDDSISKYLKGTNNELITEILVENKYSLEPFEKWNELEEKNIY